MWKSVFGLGLLFSSCLGQLPLAENYDFIIAGGGTAGLAVARRLAEGGKHSVLVLESGNFPKDGMDVPAFVPQFGADPEVTFVYPSIPQQNAGRMNNGVIVDITGKVLGGSSNLNFMWFNRGHPRDWDHWGNRTQDSSWNYSNMLKYFKRVETYSGEFPSDQHGLSGPISVSRPRYAPGLKEWLAAGEHLGYPIADPNGPQIRSFTPTECSKRRGRRVSSFSGYIQPIWGAMPKLRIILNTNVTQIIFKGTRAVGVLVNSNSPLLKSQPTRSFYANKEIVVSAGAYGSPQLLLRSGVGPKSVLRAANIPLVKDLPVGKNLHNHVAVPLPVILRNRNELKDEARDLTPATWDYFNKFGDGPYTSPLGDSGQAFAVTSLAAAENESNWPDLHLAMLHSVSALNFFFSPEIIGNDTMTPEEGPMVIAVLLTRPKSRGNLALNSSEPNGLPVIDMGYLSEQSDFEKAVEGVKLLVDICERTPSYRKLGARIPLLNFPECNRLVFKSDAYWRCYIRMTAGNGYHAAGTCTMGRGPDDPEAVVDSKLRVIGISGLRVVDTSIMPAVTNANTQAAVYGIAEKAAEMILNDWKRTYGK